MKSVYKKMSVKQLKARIRLGTDRFKLVEMEKALLERMLKK